MDNIFKFGGGGGGGGGGSKGDPASQVPDWAKYAAAGATLVALYYVNDNLGYRWVLL